MVAYDGFGRYGDFLDALEELKQQYLLDVPYSHGLDEWRRAGIWRGRRPRRSRRNAVKTVAAVAESLPIQAWHNLQIREGSHGPPGSEFAAVRVEAVRHRKRGPKIWLVIRRHSALDPETKYYVSNAPEDTLLEKFALVSGCRFGVEEYLEEAKSYLGMAQYEARGWASWHHHMSMVALVHLDVTLSRRHLKKQESELTLDMAMRLLCEALPEKNLALEDAMEIVEYHLRRNRTARRSHEKTWRETAPWNTRFIKVLL